MARSELSDWLTLRSRSPPIARTTATTPIDFDALPAVDVDVPAIYNNKQFSQELQVVIESGPLAGVVGAYYLDAERRQRSSTSAVHDRLPGLGFTALNLRRRRHQDLGRLRRLHLRFHRPVQPSRSAAATPGTSATRTSSARTSSSAARPNSAARRCSATGMPLGRRRRSNFDGKRKDTEFTPRASVSFKPNDDHNIYASYSQGFKGGGFDPRGQSTAAPDLDGDGVVDAGRDLRLHGVRSRRR